MKIGLEVHMILSNSQMMGHGVIEKFSYVDFIAEEIVFFMRDHVIMICNMIQFLHWRNCFNRKKQEEKFAH